ncbi:MAG: 50S ribosomal protein L4 [Candidatus Nanoarchaeia archaeon]
MKVKVMTLGNVEKTSRELPLHFQEAVRPDLIKRAVETIQANRRQAYGADPAAGSKHSTKLSRRRRKYRGSYGHGISRVPRKIMTRRGTRFFWVGAFAPGTVGGRRAHAPKAEKNWEKKLNAKENRKAIRSALAAVMIKELVRKRGHAVPDNYPFVIEDKLETVQKTKDLKISLEKLGLGEDLKRSLSRTLRTGIARLRGRKYRTPKGPLLVVSRPCVAQKAAANIPGVEIVPVSNLNAEVLAPGADYGRLTIFTEGALDKLQKEKLFITPFRVKKERPAKEKKKERTKAYLAAKKEAGKKKTAKNKAKKKAAKATKRQ